MALSTIFLENAMFSAGGAWLLVVAEIFDSSGFAWILFFGGSLGAEAEVLIRLSFLNYVASISFLISAGDFAIGFSGDW